MFKNIKRWYRHLFLLTILPFWGNPILAKKHLEVTNFFIQIIATKGSSIFNTFYYLQPGIQNLQIKMTEIKKKSNYWQKQICFRVKSEWNLHWNLILCCLNLTKMAQMSLLGILLSVFNKRDEHERPGVNFINILRVPFSTEVLCVAFLEWQFGFVIFGAKILVQKRLVNVDEIDSWRLKV